MRSRKGDFGLIWCLSLTKAYREGRGVESGRIDEGDSKTAWLC